MSTAKPKGIVVFSGGSAANNLVDVFKTVRENKKCPLSYIIPISDNGGSSSELIRVFGGPGIGDVRSRLVRLIPDDPDHDDSEKAAIKIFFNHRLPKDKYEAKKEWLQIVEADHALWDNFSTAKKELIRSFLNLVNFEIQKRVRPSSTFDFSAASIGNLFLTGARLFSGSFESAIYLLSSICSVPSHTSVVPAINTNFTHHISAGLTNGTVITGQNSISHPTAPSALEGATIFPDSTGLAPPMGLTPTPSEHEETEYHDKIEDANLPGSLPTLRKQNIHFSKSDDEDLSARISRLWYINPYGAEIRLSANPRVLSSLSSAQAIIYSIGSLYTSLIPSLILKGVGENIASPSIKYKILILNSTIDRETGPSSAPYSALDFIAAITKACDESRGIPSTSTSTSTSTHSPTSSSSPALNKPNYRDYVTHLIHLSGPGTPVVDKEALHELGIETIRVYGRKVEGENFIRYDEKALIQALEVTMGRGDKRAEKVRRNTMEGYGGGSGAGLWR
ncbi:UPF0052-domain-containing protein [Amniculicola lignicola CBS 123094]|uniref:UPF0052-domain-containing protein n=1 Tax=Amniculicola lignicola CBS 123094 TaxID=1392246 RepID=A0A6A5WTP4_9PLEO|nr:UPF0052-domain-containing protein [Amniculicola lignicola CBS 123094]